MHKMAKQEEQNIRLTEIVLKSIIHFHVQNLWKTQQGGL